MRARQDGTTAGTDHLRAAILAARDVVVLTAGNLEAHAREAASVAGRLDELRLAHCTLPCGRDAKVRPGSHRAVPPVGTSADEAGPDDPVLADLPEIRVPEMGERIGILVMERGMMFGPSPFAVRVIREAFDRWDRCDPHGPVLVTDGIMHSLLRLAGRPALPPGIARRDGRSGPVAETYGPAALLDCDVSRVRAWDEAMGGGAWLAGAHRVERPGIACIRDGSRAVIARLAAVPHPGHGRGTAEVYDIGADGWCTGVTAPLEGTGRCTLADIAAEAWRGGLAILDTPVKALVPGVEYSERHVVRPIHRPAALLSDGGAGDEGLAQVLDLVSGLVDLPLLAMLEDDRNQHAVVRRLASGGGDRRARRDFVATWPAFGHLLDDPGFAASVDAGAETAPLVAARLGIGLPVARRLVGRRALPEIVDMDGAGRHGTVPLAALFEAIGHDRLPARGDEAGWWAMLGLGNVLWSLLRRAEVRRPDPETCAGLMLRGANSWTARWEAYLAARVGDDEVGWGDAAEPGDMVAAFADWLGALAGRRVTAARALALLAGPGSLAKLLERSNAWHQDLNLMDGATGIPDGVRWPVPFGRVDLGDGWHAVCLATPGELRDEGSAATDASGMAGLAHCVGSYAKGCWAGDVVIVSLRHVDGGITRRVTTAEFSRDPESEIRIGSVPFTLNQHQGSRNGQPPEDAALALIRLMSALNGGRMDVDEAALVPREGLPERFGRREQVLALHDAWRAVMPRELAALDAEALAALALGADALGGDAAEGGRAR